MTETKRALAHRGVLGVCTVVALVLLGAATSYAAQLSEIRIDQPSTDNDEYFELAGSAGESLDGLTYLVIGDGTGGSGVIEAVVDLTANSISGSGFFVAAESTFSLGTADLTTGLNFENSDNVTHLLVSGFTGTNGDDLDTDDDGVLNVMPWSAMVDCVGLVETAGSGEHIYCATTVGPDGSFVPGHVYTCPGVWEIGGFDPVGGHDTPGSDNPCGAQASLSEIRIDQPSTDNDEYFELEGPAGGTLDGLTYLVIGDGTGGSGVIEAVVDLSGNSISGTGFFVVAESTFSLGTADLTANLNFENSDNVTHLVVRDFSGSSGDDLDTDDDGALDAMPWSEMLDCVGLVETVGSGDRIYCGTTVGPDGSFVPAHAFFCPAGWEIGSFDPAGGQDTPGAPNSCVGPPEVEIVINEILQNPGAVSDTDGEWFELFNPTPDPVDINGWTIRDNGSNTHVISNGGPLLIGSGSFLVLGRNADFAANGGVVVDYQYSGFFLGNSDDEVVLLDTNLVEVDRVEYDGGPSFPDPNGAAMALKAPSLDNNVGGNWCESQTPFGDGDRGTPGSPNDCLARLVINEVDADTPGSDMLEFVELYDGGDGGTDLGGLVAVFFNGNGDVSYRALDLDGFSTDADGFFVLGNSAVGPDLVFPNNGLQNGADAVALYAADAADFPNGTPVTTDKLVDALVYDTNDALDPGLLALLNAGQPQVNEGGAGNKDFHSNQRCPNGFGGQRNTDTYAQGFSTPGAINNCAPLEIFTIQGSGASSPFDGFIVSTEDNAVTAVGVDGFFMQTPAARSDGDVDTSDGIFVFTGGPPLAAVGDLVDVVGAVNEFFGLTEFSLPLSVVVDPGAATVPAPVVFDATVPSPDPTAPSCAIEFECYEGMLVEITGGAVTGPNQRFGPDPIAEVHITAGPGRTFREPGVEFPGLGMPPIPTWDGNPEVFELDPDKLGLPNQIIFAGSSFDATGVIGFEFGGYELWPSELTVDPISLPDAVRPRAPGEFTVATLNMFRFFDDFDDPPSVNFLGGIRNDSVVSTADYLLRRAKFVAHILGVLDAPDILAVEEVEKLEVLQELADDIELVDPGVVYAPFLEEGNDIGTIDVGFLVRDTIAVDAVTQLGLTEIFVNPLTGEDNVLHDRPPLLLEGRCIAGGADFSIAVMVVHNRSLGSIEDPVDGVRVRQKRFEQAESIAHKVQDLQDADPGVHLVVIGDFNAFEFTDGFVDGVGQIQGEFTPDENLVCQTNVCDDLVNPDLANQVESLSEEERYSFIFRGNAQAIDHALTGEGLNKFIRGAEYGRGNADAAFALVDDDGTLADLAVRSSDHDGLVLFLMKDTDGDGVPDDVDVCPGTTIPESVPTERLGVNRWALVDNDGVFDTTLPPGGGGGPGLGFTVGETAGCSCEQIIVGLGLGQGHVKFGCSSGAMQNWVALVNP